MYGTSITLLLSWSVGYNNWNTKNKIATPQCRFQMTDVTELNQACMEQKLK